MSSSIAGKIKKMEQQILPKSGPVDPEILRCITIFIDPGA